MIEWKEFTAPDGRKYYYNKTTKESRWTMPDEMKPAAAVAATPATAPSGTSLTAPAATLVGAAGPTAAAAQAALKAVEAARSGAKAGVFVAQPGSIQTGPTPHYATTAEAKDAFKALLNETGVSSTNSWDEVSRAIMADKRWVPRGWGGLWEERGGEAWLWMQWVSRAHEEGCVFGRGPAHCEEAWLTGSPPQGLLPSPTHPSPTPHPLNKPTTRSFGSLKTLGERKAAFNEFVQQRRKEEAEAARAARMAAKEGFYELLDGCRALDALPKFSRARDELELDPRWLAVASAREREELFEDWVEERARAEKERHRLERKRAQNALRDLLEGASWLVAGTPWRRAQDRLAGVPEFEAVDAAGRLEVFREVMEEVEKREKEAAARAREELVRSERANRAAFRELLADLRARGAVHARSRWREALALVEAEPAYLAVERNTTGSRPRELFEVGTRVMAGYDSCLDKDMGGMPWGECMAWSVPSRGCCEAQPPSTHTAYAHILTSSCRICWRTWRRRTWRTGRRSRPWSRSVASWLTSTPSWRTSWRRWAERPPPRQPRPARTALRLTAWTGATGRARTSAQGRSLSPRGHKRWAQGPSQPCPTPSPPRACERHGREGGGVHGPCWRYTCWGRKRFRLHAVCRCCRKNCVLFRQPSPPRPHPASTVPPHPHLPAQAALLRGAAGAGAG